MMKRFIERLVVYAYWPWEKKFPENRIKKRTKKAVIVTSSTCPAWIGRFLMPDALRILKDATELAGAQVVEKLYYGMVCREESQRLNPKQVAAAQKACSRLFE